MLFANRDNYGFVTFRHADEAYCAIESKLNAVFHIFSKYHNLSLHKCMIYCTNV